MFIIHRMAKYENFVHKLEDIFDAAGDATYNYKAESTRNKTEIPSYFLYGIQLEAMKTFEKATKLWYVLYRVCHS